ncbi:hypothetical protein [Streptomyces sp. DT171]|uniref:hypothetical protein n=1 Tax=Streptomyces sp. DT171 TaxID=3416524 RepID=UPI003CF1793A
MNQQITAIGTVPSAFTAGARAARLRLARTGVISRQLDQIAPGTSTVRTVPLTLDGERRTWVALDDALGLPLTADQAAHHAAYRLLRHLIPDAPWGSVALDYDVATGTVRDVSPSAPAELGLDSAEVTR